MIPESAAIAASWAKFVLADLTSLKTLRKSGTHSIVPRGTKKKTESRRQGTE